jgi:hypothetical protein
MRVPFCVERVQTHVSDRPLTAANIGGIAARTLGRLRAAMAVLFFLAIVLKLPVVGLLQRCVVASVCVWIATVTTTVARYGQSPDIQSVR